MTLFILCVIIVYSSFNLKEDRERKMGYYVNPRNESKEAFLNREGISAPDAPKITWDSVPKGFLPVVLVDNGPFTAAAIAYCKEELEYFTRLEDTRPRKIFVVRVEKLIPVSDPTFRQFAEKNGII